MMRQDTIHINDLSIGYRTKNDTKLVASHIQARIYSGELTCLLGSERSREVDASAHAVGFPAEAGRRDRRLGT